MLSRVVRRRLAASVKTRVTQSRLPQRRWNTPAPKPGDGPLMSRMADRELPDISQVQFRWRRTLPLFIAVVAAASVAIFNYQKLSSPVVSSTLYALRTSPRARAILGDEIYFKRQIPWIAGEMNQLRGRIDIHFDVRGSRGVAKMRFASVRHTSRGLFETTEWSLTTQDGQWVDLLEGEDPFKGLLGDDVVPVPVAAAEVGVVEDGAAAAADAAVTRGFRQQKTYK